MGAHLQAHWLYTIVVSGNVYGAFYKQSEHGVRMLVNFSLSYHGVRYLPICPLVFFMLPVLDSLVCLVLPYYTIPRLSPSLVTFTLSFSILHSFSPLSGNGGGNQSICLLGTISFVGLGERRLRTNAAFKHPEFCRCQGGVSRSKTYGADGMVGVWKELLVYFE